jgi:hypothetical protein
LKTARALVACGCLSGLAGCGGQGQAPAPGAGAPVPAGPPPLSCPVAEPSTALVTYYVAVNEPGADNERCDGLSPVDRGGGNCPFRDFRSQRTARLLTDVAGVRVEVRAGTYVFDEEGLNVRGTGDREEERIVLTAYENEGVLFDGAGIVRETVRLSGRYTVVERLTFRGAGAHHLEVRQGSHHRIQCNRFLANVASDALKGDPGTELTHVRHNEFTQWDSQAIDLTGVRGWTIEANMFHDPASSDGKAVGAKFGSRDVLITGNTFRHTGGLAFGGVSTAHDNEHEAFDLVAADNLFEGCRGAVVKFYSCEGCVVHDNEVDQAQGGFILGGERFEGPSGCRGGCRPTQNATVTGNRLRDLTGGPEAPPNVFWFAYATETAGLTAGQNVYCVPPGERGRFFYDGSYLTFPEWTGSTRTDHTSRVAPADREPCLPGRASLRARR